VLRILKRPTVYLGAHMAVHRERVRRFFLISNTPVRRTCSGVHVRGWSIFNSVAGHTSRSVLFDCVKNTSSYALTDARGRTTTAFEIARDRIRISVKNTKTKNENQTAQVVRVTSDIVIAGGITLNVVLSANVVGRNFRVDSLSCHNDAVRFRLWTLQTHRLSNGGGRSIIVYNILYVMRVGSRLYT